MLSAAQKVFAKLKVLIGRRGNRHAVGGRDDRFEALENRNAVFLCRAPCGLRVGVIDAREDRLFARGDFIGVKPAEPAGADDRNFHSVHGVRAFQRLR